MAWFSLAKIALQAGGKIYANRQRAKVFASALIDKGTKVKVQSTGGHKGRKQTATWF